LSWVFGLACADLVAPARVFAVAAVRLFAGALAIGRVVFPATLADLAVLVGLAALALDGGGAGRLAAGRAREAPAFGLGLVAVSRDFGFSRAVAFGAARPDATRDGFAPARAAAFFALPG
jgi:hypothetical protein